MWHSNSAKPRPDEEAQGRWMPNGSPRPEFVVLEAQGRWIRVWKQSCSDEAGSEVVWKCTSGETQICAWAIGTFGVLPKVDQKDVMHKKNIGKTWVRLTVFNMKDREGITVLWPDDMTWTKVLKRPKFGLRQYVIDKGCIDQSSDEDSVEMVSRRQLLPKHRTSAEASCSNAGPEAVAMPDEKAVVSAAPPEWAMPHEKASPRAEEAFHNDGRNLFISAKDGSSLWPPVVSAPPEWAMPTVLAMRTGDAYRRTAWLTQEEIRKLYNTAELANQIFNKKMLSFADGVLLQRVMQTWMFTRKMTFSHQTSACTNCERHASTFYDYCCRPCYDGKVFHDEYCDDRHRHKCQRLDDIDAMQ